MSIGQRQTWLLLPVTCVILEHTHPFPSGSAGGSRKVFATVEWTIDALAVTASAAVASSGYIEWLQQLEAWLVNAFPVLLLLLLICPLSSVLMVSLRCS